MLSVAIDTQATEPVPAAISHPHSASRQKDRIRAALGLARGRLPTVDGETLSRYYEYLSENLSFPFAACYPEAKNLQEENEYGCEVLELIDLHLPEDDPNFPLIEDYWYWFWNWR